MVFCPHCGTPAKLLFNLIGCMTLTCRNYDATWKGEWESSNKPRYKLNPRFGRDHEFLGNYSAESKTFDLYWCKSGKDDDICLARFGDSDKECFYVDNNEKEIGDLNQGPVNSAPSFVLAALKEALKRFRKK
jgi:hypothetical protein